MVFGVVALLVAGQARSGTTLQTEGSHPVVNINTATVDMLRLMLGVGDEEARQIVARRPYKTVDEFKAKNGEFRMFDLLKQARLAQDTQ